MAFYLQSFINVVLYQPEIPYNTGSAIRLCAAFGANLHLIRPYGFFLNHKEMKRAAVGYLDKINLVEHDTFTDFLCHAHHAPIYAFTKYGSTDLVSANITSKDKKPIYLLFGQETNGLPTEVLEHVTQRVRIPMARHVRCLNLAATVACALYEIRRADHFAGLK